jgi:hypothetical protein
MSRQPAVRVGDPAPPDAVEFMSLARASARLSGFDLCWTASRIFRRGFRGTRRSAGLGSPLGIPKPPSKRPAEV